MLNKAKNIVQSPFAGKMLLLVFLGLVVALVLLQANPYTSYPSRDGGNYAYFGRVLLEGRRPYIDVWDHKPPAVYYLNAFALWLGSGHRWGIWLVEYAFLFAAACIGFTLMRRHWQPSVAIFATVVWLSGLDRVLSGGNFTEEYSLPLSFLALYVFWLSIRKPEKLAYDLVIGLSLALSFLFRPNNIGVQVSIVLSWAILCLATRRVALLARKTAALVLGVVVVFAGVCVYFWKIGALGNMLEAALTFNFAYTSGQADLASSLLPGFSSLGFSAWVGLAGFVVAAVLLVRSIQARAINEMALLLVIGWPVEILLSALSGRGYGHYFISWLPIIALLGGLAFSSLAPQVFAPKVVEFIRDRTNAVLSISLLLLAITSWKGLGIYAESFTQILFHRGSGIEKIAPVAQYVRANTEADDEILVWGGQGGIYVMARRDAATAYYLYPLYVDSRILPKLDDGFFQDVTARRPVLIIDAYIDAPDDVLSIDPTVRATQISLGKGQLYRPPHLDQFFEFVQENYVLETVVDGYTIYRLGHP